MNTLTRGNVVMVELQSGERNVQKGLRPCIVIQNNMGNKFSPTVIIAPLTSRTKKDMITHTKITPSTENGLSVPSTALLEQIQTISKDSIKKVLGVLSAFDMERVNSAIKNSLAI